VFSKPEHLNYKGLVQSAHSTHLSCPTLDKATSPALSTFIDICGCARVVARVANGRSSSNSGSVCSAHATRRGAGQRVLSYAIYGPILRNGYFRGIESNLRGMREHYPGYVMRLYHDRSEEDEEGQRTLCGLYCANPELDLCYVRRLGSLAAGDRWN
jgi:hypothetical protein